jgi:hypothetical protein
MYAGIIQFAESIKAFAGQNLCGSARTIKEL